DRPGGTRRGVAELVDVGEVAGTGQGEAEGVGDRRGGAQLGVAEAVARILHRLVVVLGHGPRHGRLLLAGRSREPSGTFFWSRSARGTYCAARATRVPMSRKRITDTRSALKAKPRAPSATAKPSARAASSIRG